MVDVPIPGTIAVIIPRHSGQKPRLKMNPQFRSRTTKDLRERVWLDGSLAVEGLPRPRPNAIPQLEIQIVMIPVAIVVSDPVWITDKPVRMPGANRLLISPCVLSG